VSDIARLAAQTGEEFDLQIFDCGVELPLRVSGRAGPAVAYRGGFSPPADGKPEPGYREASYRSVNELKKGLDEDLAAGLQCLDGLVGLHTPCHAYSFRSRFGRGTRVEAVEPVEAWE
jgi:hypothetical protein